MATTTPFRVTCFAGAVQGRQAAGNAADVYLDAPLPADPGGSDQTRVYVGGDAARWRVTSLSAAGQPIRFCGHGALAAAAVIARAGADWRLPYVSEFMDWDAIRVSESRQAADVTLRFSRPVFELCPVPEFAAATGVDEFSQAAQLGGDNDYLILAATTAADVALASPDFDAIAAATKRAVCLSAPTDEGFVFRYFAPQYGEDEDAATGSAAVQLASFWADRSQRSSFKVEQFSPAGGCMQLVCNADTVELTGRVAYG